jgi:tetratricopeptide (TPR) repeat protein
VPIRFTLHPLLLIAVTLVPLSAKGDQSGSPRLADHAADTARAEAMFEEGRKLMVAHDYTAACPKLAESERLDPAPGTLLNLAVCYERANKTATAWATYKSAALLAQRSGEPDRAAAATRKAAELEPRLARLTVTVAPTPGLEVRCDGQPLGEPSWGVALPYDAGDHEVQATAPGHRPWSLRVHIAGDAQTAKVAVPALEATPLPPAAAEEPTRSEHEAAAPAEPPRDGHGQRLAGEIVLVAGVLGIGVGVYSGLHAKASYDEAVSDCGGTVCPAGSDGLKLRGQASDWATASTAAFIAGGAAALGGAILFFAAPHGAIVAIGPAAQGTGLSLSGRF